MASPELTRFRIREFELDAATGELRKAGTLVKLQPQPFRVLLLLVERAGQLVTREEIQRCLWTDSTFVDFEHGINFCVNQIRTALGDDAEKPRYVETLPRRGYRFVGPVKDVNADAACTSTEASIAVLPFTNMSPDAENEFFADGITEEIINALTRIEKLRVAARRSAFSFKDKHVDLHIIGERLNVKTILEGSVRKAGNRIRIMVQLINVADGYHLWAESYDRELRDVLELDNEVARAVAKEIKVTLTREDETRLGGIRRVNPPAYEAYLQGRYFLDRRTKAGVDKALAYFQQAIELDPTYASAHACLAEVFLVQGLYDPPHQMELLAQSQAASLKALELDDGLSTAHYTLAAQRLRVWNWSGAEVEYRRAIELNPSDATAHAWYANLLITMGRMTEAEVEMQRAQELDPLSLEVYGAVTGYLYYARRYDELISRFREWVERDPDLEWIYHHGLGAAHVQMGRPQEAITELRIALKSSTLHDNTATELANALAVAGKREEALKMLDQVENAPWKTFGAALVHTGLGEKDEAFHSLQRAIELRAPWPFVSLLKQDPRFDSLRQDPRFEDLLRRMNFPNSRISVSY